MPRQKQSKTIMEQHGFKDVDLTTPVHDDICIWVEENALEIVSELDIFKYSEILDDTMINSLVAYYRTTLVENRFGDEGLTEEDLLDDIRKKLHQYRRPPILVDKVVWEPAIINTKDFEIGFLDLVVHVRIPTPWFEGTLPDVKVITRYKEGYKIWFEVKSSIPSLGELFRQLSFYRNHVKDPIVVVAPDTQHKERIQQQGYYFIEPPVTVKHSKPSIQKQTLFGPMTVKKD